MRRVSHAVLGVYLSAALPVAAAPADSAAIDFARDADYEIVEISPSGTNLALTQRRDGLETVIVVRLADFAPLTNTSFGENIEIERIDWVNDERLLIQPARRFPGFTDYKAPTGEFVGMDADGKNVELLFGPLAGQQQTGTRVQRRESVSLQGGWSTCCPATTSGY
ncbi:MAG: hypothetical protein HC809_07100 [Gammaproteobacteria bacterium]|nr:hypothetical protein [Gammaproteobacteria bacterium]